MSVDRLRSELRQVEAGRWHTATGEQSERWLPLLPVSATGMWLGLAVSGDWLLGRLGGRLAESTQRMSQAWLTILESEESIFRSELAVAAADMGISVDILQNLLPVDQIISLGMRSGSAHWADRAVRWLRCKSINAEQRSLLVGIMNAKWANQYTRQTARNLLGA